MLNKAMMAEPRFVSIPIRNLKLTMQVMRVSQLAQKRVFGSVGVTPLRNVAYKCGFQFLLDVLSLQRQRSHPQDGTRPVRIVLPYVEDEGARPLLQDKKITDDLLRFRLSKQFKILKRQCDYNAYIETRVPFFSHGNGVPHTRYFQDLARCPKMKMKDMCYHSLPLSSTRVGLDLHSQSLRRFEGNT